MNSKQKMNKKIVLVFLAAMALNVLGDEKFKCHQCALVKIEDMDKECKEKECTDSNTKGCIKNTIFNKDQEYVIKGCTDPYLELDACIKGKYTGGDRKGDTAICSCKGENCNSGSGLTFAAATMIPLFILKAIL